MNSRFLPKLNLLIIIILVGVWYFLFLKEKSCDTPIQYKIGSFDSRFGISQKDFLQDINKAENIWEKSIDKNLFEYNPKGKLTIHLIYDDRQKTTVQNAVLKTDADKIKRLADSVKEQYLSLQEKYEILQQEYKNDLSIFNQNKDNYASQVDYWNNQGGAPREEYNKLIAEKDKLTSEQAVLENKRIELNILVNKINAFINDYNLLVDSANLNINTINLSAGKEFEEGIYDQNKNEIYIYEFSSNQKLIRVLAHEFGHALLLPHNNNPQSIMYSLNKSNTLLLSKEDMETLKTRCKIPQ